MKTAKEHAKDIWDALNSRERNEADLIEARDRSMQADGLRMAQALIRVHGDVAHMKIGHLADELERT